MQTSSLVLMLLTTLLACKHIPSQQRLNQGIYGKLTWLEGNQMPGPGREPAIDDPVERTVLVYSLIKTDQLQKSDALFVKPDLKPISTTVSDENGDFRLALPSGHYSVLIQEENGVFAAFFDGEGHVNPVKVEDNQYVELNIKIDYKAFY